MRRRTHRRLVLTGQLLLLGGLALAAACNVVSLVSGLLDPGWWGLTLALPGLLLWLGALTAPHLLARAVLADGGETFRLVYDAPDGWQDDTARAALRALARSARLSITWARDGAGTGCWLVVPEGWGEVLRRLVGDVFPGGQVEADRPPTLGKGVVILRWQGEAPAPTDLCRLEGVEGVYYRRRGQGTATVALWGAESRNVARQWAKRSDLLPGQGDGLRRPPFGGEDPWPGLPPFPPSREDPGLAARSRLERLAPALRVNGSQALVLGRDAEGKAVGFSLSGLTGMESLWIVGQAAESAAVDLACQAVQAGLLTLFLDGRGTATARMARRLLRETAAGRVLLCDVERPAQTRFRLNPLWLPTAVETWPRVLANWLDWLREMGVTPAGLGRAAYRHTRVTVILTALAAAGSDLALDIPRLRDALDAPDFLSLLDEEALPCAPRDLLGAETWDWWLAEGRTAPNFDVHLRLGHLRDRLNALLALPEYGVLWQAPYLDPLGALSEGVVEAAM